MRNAVAREQLVTHVTLDYVVVIAFAVVVGALYASSCWGVVAGYGQVEGGAVFELDLLLY